MGLPLSGPISSSQVGVYVFDRLSNDIFSLSASLAGTTVDKGYTTQIGPLWRGNGVSDVNNQQYNAGANNFSLSDWYGYFKGFKANRSDNYRGNPAAACDDFTEFAELYYTAGDYFNAGPETKIYNNSTVAYTNTSGTSPFAGNSNDYFKVFEANAAYTFDGNGVFENEYIC